MEVDNHQVVGLSTDPIPISPAAEQIKNGSKKVSCGICNITIHSNEWESHLEGKKHQNNTFRMKNLESLQQEGVLVSGFKIKTTAQQIFHHFRKFGYVIGIYMEENRDEALVQFVNKSSTRSVLRASHHLNGHSLKVRPRSCWSTASEESSKKRTIPTPKMIYRLLAPFGNQKIEEQISHLVSSIESTKEEEVEWGRICRSLENFLSISFPGCTIHPFGSAVAGLAFRGSDLDLHIESSKVSCRANAGSNPNFLSRAVKVLRTHPEVEALFFVRSARVPVINMKFSGISCDITSHNQLGIQNSKLLRLLQSFDIRIKPYLYIIKYWIKSQRLTGSSELSMSSYATTLMAVLYLQQLNPPILPPIEALQEHIPDQERQTCNNWNIGFNTSFSFEESKKNPSSIIELVRGFFAFYGQLQPENIVLCPLIGTVMNKEDFALHDQLPRCMEPYVININAGMSELKMKQLTIQDPFELNFNPVSNVQNYEKIQKAFMKAHDICQSIIDKKCDDGLASLFFCNPTPPKSRISETREKNCTSISMKFKPTEKVSEESVDSFLKKLETFFDRLFRWAYFITAVQIPLESSTENNCRTSPLNESTPQESQDQIETLLKWNQSYSLDVPFDLWTERKAMSQSLTPELVMLPVFDKERTISSRIREGSPAVSSDLFISVTFNMIYRVKSSTVVLSFEKSAHTTQERFNQFTKGLRYHIKSVIDRYLIENQFTFLNIHC